MLQKALLALVISASMVSCVSNGTHEAMIKQRDILAKEKEDLLRENENLTNQVLSKVKKNQSLTKQLVRLKKELSLLQGNFDSLKKNSAAGTKELIARMEKLQKDIRIKEDKIAEIKAKLEAREAKVKALQQVLDKALLGFRDSGLSVSIKDGKVYVSLSNQLLFKSGSTKIDKKGQTALLGLAEVLNAQNEINVLVEGHTDNAKVGSGKRFADNWDLSVLRATEVVRYLTVDGKVDPKRVIASGRGEYFPIEEGETKEVRAKNRRTEIILTPKLEELFEIIN